MKNLSIKFKELIGLSLVSVGIGLSLLGVWLCVYGGDYVQHKTYEIQTKTGETLKLSCPTLDMNRSKYTYCGKNLIQVEEAEEDGLKVGAADIARLDWLEQHIWATERECLDLINSWKTPDGTFHGRGLRSAIDALMGG